MKFLIKKIEERQELSKLFAKEAFGQLHNWYPASKEGKAENAIFQIRA